jgi:hypothetical protein
MALQVPAIFLLAMPLGSLSTALMEFVPSRMRSQAGALYLFVGNFIGLGMGPTAVALCTDYIFHDDNMVGYSLLIVGVAGQLMAAMFFWAGLKPFMRSKAHLSEWTAAQAA